MNRYFLRWLRSGAAGAVTGEEGAGLDQLRASFAVTATVSGVGTVTRNVALHGPGDVVGLSPAQIILRVPAPGSTTADASAFAHVELDDPDMPWRYSPFHEHTAADPAGSILLRQGTVTPWLCLIVVEQRAGVSLDYRAGDLLPVLTIANPDNELPKTDELHAWAHVQLTGAAAADLPGLPDNHPERTLSRLVCPRLLAPQTAYLACLVPVFATGRQAGLGETVTAGLDEPAWLRGKPTVRLPVYDSYTFTTGPGGDFESLVRRLRHVRLDALTDPDLNPVVVGRRPLDVTSPGFGVPDRPEPETVDLLGALHLQGADPLAPLTDPDLGTAIEKAVDVGDRLTPPVYGRWPAAAKVPHGASTWPTWLATLNTHPGLRVPAGMGTRLVQRRQEEFMAACWEQVGEILRANQLLRQAQLAQLASTALYWRHIAVLDPVPVLHLLAPVLSRLRSAADPSRTLWADIGASCLPVLALSGHWRRLLRPRGPLIRRVERWLTGRHDQRRYDPAGLVLALAGGDRLGPAPLPQPSVLVGTAHLARALASETSLTWPSAEPSGADMAALAATLRVLTDRVAPPPTCQPAPLARLAGATVRQVNPAVTVPRRARAQLRLPAGLWDPPDRIDPIMVAPEITAPMYRFLAELGQDWLLPGLQHVPADSVSAVAANQVFVEAFLVGMNHEMSRELLWRGYPTDQRGTVFRHFWDTRTAAAPPPGDIDRVHTWPTTSQLGSHFPGGSTGDRFVFVLRGEVLRRFPGASVFLVRATLVDSVPTPAPIDTTSEPPTALLPSFSGRLDPDVTFLGFDISVDDVWGDDPPTTDRPGWFVALQEQPTQPSFGVSGKAGPLVNGRYKSWADLGVTDFAVVGGQTADDKPVGYIDLAATTYLSAVTMEPTAFMGRIPPDPIPPEPGLPDWDGRSDTLAAIVLRRPFRLFLHGSTILPAPVNP